MPAATGMGYSTHHILIQTENWFGINTHREDMMMVQFFNNTSVTLNIWNFYKPPKVYLSFFFRILSSPRVALNMNLLHSRN